MAPPPPTSTAPAVLARQDEASLIAALRDGDEEAFAALVTTHHASLKRVARMYVSTDAVAEEVVQETWMAVLKGLPRFEGRSSLKTWIFHILANVAKTRGTRERRCVPFSGLAFDDEDTSPSVPPERFQGPDGTWPSHWASPPRAWEDPERRLASLEAREYLKRAIGALPSVQQAVLTYRDVEGLTAEEVCGLMGLTDGNQRVILHRARSRLRASLEQYMER